MELWEILVPTVRRTTGVPYRTRYHKVFDAKVRAITGGLTVLAPAKGQWTSKEGELFSERMIPVRIACDENQIHKIIEIVLTYYDQIAVMAYRVSERCIIKHRKL